MIGIVEQEPIFKSLYQDSIQITQSYILEKLLKDIKTKINCYSTMLRKKLNADAINIDVINTVTKELHTFITDKFKPFANRTKASLTESEKKDFFALEQMLNLFKTINTIAGDRSFKPENRLKRILDCFTLFVIEEENANIQSLDGMQFYLEQLQRKMKDQNQKAGCNNNVPLSPSTKLSSNTPSNNWATQWKKTAPRKQLTIKEITDLPLGMKVNL